MSAPERNTTPRRRVRRRRRAARRGVALIMVLGAITVLTVFLTELQEETAAELSSAIAERDALKAEYIAKSAVNLSRLLITSQDALLDSLRSIPFIGSALPPQIPIWQAADIALGIFNDEAGVAAFGGFVGADLSSGKNMGLSGGRFELKIVDEDGRFNINKVSRGLIPGLQAAAFMTALMLGPQYDPMFEERDADNQFSDRAAICSEIIDYADFNFSGSEEIFPCDGSTINTGSKGPEDNFYQNIGLGYVRKNAPYDSIDELRLVRGIGSDTFWSTFIEHDANDPESRLITVWGLNTVNINTAQPLTLLTLACANTIPGTEPLCLPENAVIFLQRAMLLKAMLPPAIPLFSKPRDFITLMKGGGGAAGGNANSFSLVPMIAAQLFAAQPPLPALQAITKFNISDGELLKQVSVKSERFSVYAEGVIPGFKRETRVRIHAVIDTKLLPPQATNSTNALTGPGVLEDPLKKPPGTIIYWRVE